MAATVPVLHIADRRSGLKLDWGLFDHATSPHRLITSGKAWTQRGARRLARQWLVDGEAELATKRAGIRDKRNDGLVA